ncbi:hypothetical protein OS189_10000 [Sulfitobacter sp. F26169L]|uniref:hypothetical protein n=1 Tax=Sulfitobacter sp. F26169L TaxID=2996015 RepID=UPI002260B475|nr:hypothetical protein [Sulfitobacter sp. F26169L]MCX7566673.1 hypothetical protein [Sulfitobacter sp. F26169L]
MSEVRIRLKDLGQCVNKGWEDAKSVSGEINFLLFALFILLGALLIIILPDATTGVVAGTSALIIAFVAYPWQKEKDRVLKIEDEQRKALSELIGALDAYMAKVRLSSPLRTACVPNTETERIDVEMHLAIAGAYSGSAIEPVARGYNNGIENYQNMLEIEKEIRRGIPEGEFNNGLLTKRPKEYVEAQDKRRTAFAEMVEFRDLFNAKVSELLRIQFAKIELKEPRQSMDEEEKK